VSAREITPHASGFAGARTLLSVQSWRRVTRKNEESRETRHYLSSLDIGDAPLQRQAELIRGHWGAVENNTHWRRDTLMGEDGMRSRKPVLLSNVALLRNALLSLCAWEYGGHNMVSLQETMHRSPRLALRLLRAT